MKVPLARYEPERIEGDASVELLNAPVIVRFASVALMKNESKDLCMVLVAVDPDSNPLGIMPITNLDVAKAVAKGIVKTATTIFGPDKGEAS